jgi:hypothetical protein
VVRRHICPPKSERRTPAVSSHKCKLSKNLAEGVGVEPTTGFCPAPDFESGSSSPLMAVEAHTSAILGRRCVAILLHSPTSVARRSL